MKKCLHCELTALIFAHAEEHGQPFGEDGGKGHPLHYLAEMMSQVLAEVIVTVADGDAQKLIGGVKQVRDAFEHAVIVEYARTRGMTATFIHLTPDNDGAQGPADPKGTVQ